MALLTHNKTHPKKLDLQTQITLEDPKKSQLRPPHNTANFEKNAKSTEPATPPKFCLIETKRTAGIRAEIIRTHTYRATH